MPIYKIKDVNLDNNPLVEYNDMIKHINEFLTNSGIHPTIFVSNNVYDIINKSSRFSFRDVKSGPSNYLGHFMGWSVFISDKLYNNEYFLDVYDKEIDFYRRKDKLEQIINKLCGHITEEKQK